MCQILAANLKTDKCDFQKENANPSRTGSFYAVSVQNNENHRAFIFSHASFFVTPTPLK